MAAKKSDKLSLPDSTIITVVERCGDKVAVTDMELGKAKLLLSKKSKFKYQFFQVGFCTVKPNI